MSLNTPQAEARPHVGTLQATELLAGGKLRHKAARLTSRQLGLNSEQFNSHLKQP